MRFGFLLLYLALLLGCSNSKDTQKDRSSKHDTPITKKKKEKKIEKNKAPKFISFPKQMNYRYDLFHFFPDVEDEKKDSLTFSIKHKPDWLEFDNKSGELYGVANKEGNFSGITLSVSDGEFDDNITFDIVVQKEQNLAHYYAKAREGGSIHYQYYKEAKYAIDANLSTYNHTECSDPNNWLELEFPNKVTPKKIVIYNRKGQNHRLDGAKIYLQDIPYNEGVQKTDEIGVLNSDLEQTLRFDKNKSAKYLIIKNRSQSSDACLHIREVEVYGTMANSPIINNPPTKRILLDSYNQGDIVYRVDSSDLQGDRLIFSIDDNHSPFSIDTKGVIRTREHLKPNHNYNFRIKVSDGKDSVHLDIEFKTTDLNAIEKLLIDGNIKKTPVTKEQIYDSLLYEIDKSINGDWGVEDIFGDKKIEYFPGNYASSLIDIDSFRLGSDYMPLLIGRKGHIFALWGKHRPYAIFAFDPTSTFIEHESDFEESIKKIVLKLLKTKSFNNKKVALIYPNSSSDKSWFESLGLSVKVCKDDLIECSQGSDLLVIGSASNDKKSLDTLLSLDQKAFIYLHPNWGENSISSLMEEKFIFRFPYGGNYFQKESINWDNFEEMKISFIKNQKLDAIKEMILHLQREDYNFDWSRCYTYKTDKKIYSSKYDKCEEVVGLNKTFFDGAKRVKKIINNIDRSKIDLFEMDGYRLSKLLILLGDKLREEVSYPMDKQITNQSDFFSSLYADSSVYNFRKSNPPQRDMGNFSHSSFDSVKVTTIKRKIQAKAPFRSAGVYMLPGKSMTIKRVDTNSSIKTEIFINTLRSGATHLFQKWGYNRPKYLQTPKFEIKVGQSITLTSPYGGLVQIATDRNGAFVELEFQDVALHPIWAYWMDDEQKRNFESSLDEGLFDWAEVITPNFELHSKTKKLKASIADPKWGNVDNFIDAINQYTSNYPYSLAGFKGPGIETIDEVVSFANEHNLEIKYSDFVKHMNADQASCGYGCSGNPYDAYWSFDPISHGDLHEIGHGLEKSIFRFDGWNYHASTNPYSYYTKSRYNKDHDDEELTSCQNLPFHKLYDIINEAKDEENRSLYLQEHLWKDSSWSEEFLFELQAMMLTQYMGKLDDGWHLLTRLHLLERARWNAKKDWQNKKDDIGFSNYSLDEFNHISNNDWLLVSYSFSTQIDFRDFFDIYGLSYSKKAASQVESFGYPKALKRFFKSTPNGYCSVDKYGAYLAKESIELGESFE